MTEKSKDYIEVPKYIKKGRSTGGLWGAIEKVLPRIGSQEFTSQQMNMILKDEKYVFKGETNGIIRISNILLRMEREGAITRVFHGKQKRPIYYKAKD